MAGTSRAAAQYIRMSTDRQDLSPLVQKDAIATYAAINGLELVATYEDEGRSGVHLKNRPGLMRLLRDVTNGAPFSTVLVYDVSRWGRFQDADASAYYEYHCRLHGVRIVYVAEVFGSDITPMSVLAKALKRAMAAEYSRELATKCRAGQGRVVNMGFQLGVLPALGYRRCSVSADGKRRVMLEANQRKLAQTDRVEWVLAPEPEIAIAREICNAYARSNLRFTDIANLAQARGWRDHKGRKLTKQALNCFVRNEALIGNFVWGRRQHPNRIVKSEPSRANGAVPRIIDDDTWALMQARLANEPALKSDDELLDELRHAINLNPALSTNDLPAYGCSVRTTYRTRFGNWSNAVRRAGSDPAQLANIRVDRARTCRAHVRVFGVALAEALHKESIDAVFDGRLDQLTLGRARLRLRLAWLADEKSSKRAWYIRTLTVEPSDCVLLVRMSEPYCAMDYFVVPGFDLRTRFPSWLSEQIPDELARYWCRFPAELIERLRSLTTV